MPPDLALAELLRALVAIVALPAFAPGVVLLVNLVKRLAPAWKGEHVALVVQVLVWAGYQLAAHAGLAVQFDQWWAVLVALLSAVLSLPSLFTGGVVAQAVHTFAVRRRLPLLGYQRTPGARP